MAKVRGEKKEVAGCLQGHGPSIWPLVPACSPVLGCSEIGKVGIGDAHTRAVEVGGDEPVPGNSLRHAGAAVTLWCLAMRCGAGAPCPNPHLLVS